MIPPNANSTRKNRRFAVDVEATLDIKGQRLRARTRDISRSGICLITDQPIAAGQLLPVELVLAFGDDAYSEPLSLTARIVWCTNLDGNYQVGAMFDEVTDQQDGFLEMFLEYLDEALSPDEDTNDPFGR
ncbi:MAG TPA: PilZ domain-containing protein [Polyangia bacterium]